MNKVLYIPAYFRETGKNVTKKVDTGEKKAGLLWGENKVYEKVTEWEATGVSDCRVDGERLSHDINLATEALNAEGYEIVSITPVTSGHYKYEYKKDYSSHSSMSYGWGWGYGYGFSFTEGVTIIAKKMT